MYLSGDVAERQLRLVQLVMSDLKFRLSADPIFRVETYLDRFPELRADSNLLLELVTAEFRLRQTSGINPSYKEYFDRFPTIANRLQKVFSDIIDESSECSGIDDEFITSSNKSSDTPTVGFEGPVGIQIGGELASGRFQVLKKIGAGGMGVVLSALDRTKQKKVALKVLPEPEGMKLSRFKKEFRSLAEVIHPNLVQLYELFGDGDTWFYSMELVEGPELLEYVRRDDETDFARLYSCFSQLANGINAIHKAGQVHRDIKSANVMVSINDHRVVLLDFGLATHLPSRDILESTEQILAGTIPFMAPEQLDGQANAASDWYAYGALLYVCLTGRHAFQGTISEIILQKVNGEANFPESLFRPVPRQLRNLCQKLLSRDPLQRAGYDETIESIGKQPRVISSVSASNPTEIGEFFVGRQTYLDRLNKIYDELGTCGPVVAWIAGESGVGKSELIKQFVRKIKNSADGLFFAGCCFQNEMVPYKALDGVVDGLSRYLGKISTTDAAELIPRHVNALLQVFPVLASVGVFMKAAEKLSTPPDPAEARIRSSIALADLVGKINDQKKIVIFVDDLQWGGDPDSIYLLEKLFRLGDCRNVLFLASFRSEFSESNEFLTSLQGQLESVDGLHHEHICVQPFDDAESQTLFEKVSGRPISPSERTLIKECQGFPFFILQAALYLKESATDTSAGAINNLDELVWNRILQTSKHSQSLLKLLAVAGNPLLKSELRQIVDTPNELDGALEQLRILRLSQRLNTDADQDTSIDFYHDKIREIAAHHVTKTEANQWHVKIIGLLRSTDNPDSERLAYHLDSIGLKAESLECYRIAAQQSRSQFAFQRSIRLFEKCLDEFKLVVQQRNDLLQELAVTHAMAGQSSSAARYFLELADLEEGESAIEYRSKAASQLIMAGQLRKGLVEFRTVVKSLGLHFPESQFGLELRLVWERSVLAVRGYAFKAKPISSIPRKVRLQIESLTHVASSLQATDVCWHPCSIPKGFGWLSIMGTRNTCQWHLV